MKSQEDNNPVLLYQPNVTDYILIIQSPFQANMLKTFSSQKAVFIDDTHGTNAYGLHLTTLLVVDDYGEGLPVAWCISSYVDTATISIFFKEVKNKTGELNPTWFMSDDADQFFNAWANTFEHTPKRILCTWHVLRAWKSHLKGVRDRDKEEEVYHELKVLMDETNPKVFEVMVENACKKWKKDANTEQFADYFQKYYKGRCEQWACCYRAASGANTNMYMEAFHHVLKYKYLKGKNNRRIDRLVQSLMEYLRHKSFDRIIKLEKGKITGRIAQIQKRHRTSKVLSHELISQVEPSLWKVKSETGDNEYTVQEIAKSCVENCNVKCIDCNVCVHLFSCSCPDSLLQHTICKHVHLICRHRDDVSSDMDKLLTKSSVEISDSDMQDATLMNEVTLDYSPPLDVLKHRIVQQLESMINLVTLSTSVDALKTVEKSLNAAKCTLAVMQNEEAVLIPKNSVPNTKMVEKQRSFCTKKKNRRCKIKFGNPSLGQRKRIKVDLLGIEQDAVGMYMHTVFIVYGIYCIYRCRIKPFLYNII